MFESTVMGVPLDSQTYIKAIRYLSMQQTTDANDSTTKLNCASNLQRDETVRYLREQLSREVHGQDLSFVESLLVLTSEKEDKSTVRASEDA